MKQKQFTKKEVEKKIEKVLDKLKEKKLEGKTFPLSDVLGDYQFNSRNRYIKEAIFFSTESHGKQGGNWYLKYPRMKAKQLAKIVMKTVLIGGRGWQF